MEVASYLLLILAGIVLSVFTVVYSSHKTSSLWFLFFPSVLLFALAGTLYWQAKISDEAKSAQALPTAGAPFEAPTFTEMRKETTLSVGSITYKMTLAALQNNPIEPLDIYGYKPLRFYAEGSKLFVDVTLYSGANESAVEIKHNEFNVRPPDWDRNSSQTALEVVDKAGMPQFQLIYKTPTHLIVYGVFSTPAGPVLIDDAGMRVNPQPPETLRLKPIFRYPSWKYPGQYAE